MRSSGTRAEAVPGSSGSVGTSPRVGRAVLTAVLAGLLSLVVAGPATAQPRPGAEDGTLPSELAAEVQRHRGYPVAPVSALAGSALSEVEVGGARVRAQLGDRPIELLAESPFYRIGGNVRQLPNAPYREAGEFWIPVEALSGATAGSASAAAAGRRAGPWRVVIDPGHGGRDPGARGPRGTREKDVVLAVARKLQDRLAQEADIEASLTRTGDEFLALAERSRIAVERGADLFLSIHANSSRARRARGFETFFLGEARTEESRQVAMRENAAVQYQQDSEWSSEEQVAYILASADQRAYVQESNYLAGYIQNQLRPRHSGPDRGVKQAGFYVLMGASGSMPAVLVETGFISNPSGERLLTSTRGQERIAAGVAEAVIRYFRERERRGGVRTARR